MSAINANTKINAILKAHPDALEAIISISPKFNKLRNPLLRKVVAARTSIREASKIAGCSPGDFFKKLSPLGFTIDENAAPNLQDHRSQASFIQNAEPAMIEELDVRPVIESGKDPFSMITRKIKQLEPGKILKLVNTFEPVPLINILSKQGFEYYVETVSENLVNTYFHKTTSANENIAGGTQSSGDWDNILLQFNNNLVTIDVRHLQMPQPMHTILDTLETLPDDKALFVYHKRIPVFLLPELAERKFDHRIKEITDGEVHLLIFKMK
jgi:uncharacterized protein (DUF2249 family)